MIRRMRKFLHTTVAAIAMGVPAAAQVADSTDLDFFGEHDMCGDFTCGGFGSSLAAGDLNGDGVRDLVVGASGAKGISGDAAGAAYVFFGPVTRGRNARNADAIVRGVAFSDQAAVVGAGDLDGDGVDDLVIGAPGTDPDGKILAGQVFVLYGPLAGEASVLDADATITGRAFHELGRAVTVADFNADGLADVAAGAPEAASENGGLGFAGRAHVFFGPVFGSLDSSEADATISGTRANDELGTSLATGDLDGDGVADLLMGAPFFPLGDTGAGRAFAFFAPFVGSLTAADADLTLLGALDGDRFGVSVAVAADENGDGFADALVGADHLFRNPPEANPGRAYLFEGPLMGTVSADAAAAVLEGEIDPIENPQFGAAVTAGDSNGDGLSDLAIGATFATNTRLGRAYVFHGPVAGLVPAATADLAFTGPGLDPFGDFMGTSLLVTDLDEDGLGDVTMGAPGFTDGDGFARVFVPPGLTVRATLQGSGTVPPEGGPITFAADVGNTSTAARHVEAWLRIENAPAGVDRRRGPIELVLKAGGTFSRAVTLQVPGGAPPGRYTVTLAAGAFPHRSATASFTFDKLAE